MSYSDTELLIGVLIVACLLLLYCKSNNSESDVEGYKNNKVFNGTSGLVPLSFGRTAKHLERYTVMPPAGTFKSGFTAGYAYAPELAEGNFNRGVEFNDSLPIAGLHEKETRQTPASYNCSTPEKTEVDIKWMPDMSIVPNVYGADRNMFTGLAASDNDMAFMDMYIRNKTAPAVAGPKNPSVGGVSLALSDFGSEKDVKDSNEIFSL